ncbi:hypothetical protein RFI_12816 [Reticulomyxa filosa]|uniref:Uncharacterized protein n=1 Tax=Reticulomyxa filosa TaxID=46433 RepID=X6NDD0_RETFI|nr:hypothetical protein RFI_12816 [Reticulomyxa filosa]|eukprot:ETO24340.1 hypothetical protein RFI_12816 [Reticulomyxa filosa]
MFIGKDPYSNCIPKTSKMTFHATSVYLKTNCICSKRYTFSVLSLHNSEARAQRKTMNGKWLVTGSLIFGFLYIFSTAIITHLLLVEKELPCISNNFRVLFIYSERVLMYYYFCIRMKTTFEKTVYAYPKCFMDILFLFTILIFFTGLTWYYYWSWRCTTSGVVIGYTALVIFDCFCAVSLWCLFVYKMRQVVRAMRTVDKGVSDYKSPELLKVERLISKLTILSSVTIVSSLLSYITYPWLWTSIVQVDTIINSLCLILSFQRYHFWYLFWCTTCRKCCERNNLWDTKQEITFILEKKDITMLSLINTHFFDLSIIFWAILKVD